MMDINWWLIVGTLGPLGLIGLVRASLTAYNDWKRESEPHFELAPQVEVLELEETLVEMMPRLFGISYDECLVTDDSTVGFFPLNSLDETEGFEEILLREYNIRRDELPDDRLVSIARAIRNIAV